LNGAERAFFGSVALVLGQQSEQRWQIDVDRACDYVDRVAAFQQSDAPADTIAFTRPIGLHVSGAEPFAQTDDLERLLARATRHAMRAEVLTNACWVEDRAAADALVRRFGGKIHLLTILTGRKEIDRRGIATLEWLLLALRQANMSFQLLVGVGAGSPFPKELLGLEVVNCDTSVIRVEPLAYGANAGWPAHYLLTAPPRYARCAELMGFVIAPGGEVYPCANGIGLAQLRLGNMQTQSVGEIVEGALAKADLHRLRDEGPYFLYDGLRRCRRAALLPREFVSSCDFHRQLLTNAAAAKLHVEDLSAEASAP